MAFTSELHQSEMSMLLGNSGGGWFPFQASRFLKRPTANPELSLPVPLPLFPEINSLNRRPLDWIGLD